MMRVAIFGASGFVGAALVERLWADPQIEVKPIIHSSGNAARLARTGRPLIMADLMAPETLAGALQGCTHVVNCARGSSETMIRGLQHLLDACQKAGVKRFVHVSSVAAYGEGHRGRVVESAQATPPPNSYGDTKLRQDRLVERAARRGLSCAILCPPNISGAHSPFLLEIVQALSRGQLGLVDGGDHPCELVDVANLVHAIILALKADVPDAQRMFVTDGKPVAWGELARRLQPLAESMEPIPSIPLEQALELVRRAEPPPPSVRRALRHLLSSDVRQALKRDTWFTNTERTLKSMITGVPALDRMLRQRFASGERVVKTGGGGPALSARLVKQQLRDVEYSQERARQILGYTPPLSFDASMTGFAEWYATHYGWRNEWWPLLQQLRTA